MGLLWCNVLKDGTLDERLVHAACPVYGEEQKFGMNVFVTKENMQGLATMGVSEIPTTVSRPVHSGPSQQQWDDVMEYFPADPKSGPKRAAPQKGAPQKRKAEKGNGNKKAKRK